MQKHAASLRLYPVHFGPWTVARTLKVSTLNAKRETVPLFGILKDTVWTENRPPCGATRGMFGKRAMLDSGPRTELLFFLFEA